MGDLHYWLETLSALCVAGGLFLNAIEHHSATEARRVSNLLALTQHHDEIWKGADNDPKLSRIEKRDVDTSKYPVTRAEKIFVNRVIQHLNSVYYTMRHDLTIKPEGLSRDVREFFGFPIPSAVWNTLKDLQNPAFVQFVEKSLNGK